MTPWGDRVVADTQFFPRVVGALVRLFERGELAFVRLDDKEVSGLSAA
jgi:hypothetical protein